MEYGVDKNLIACEIEILQEFSKVCEKLDIKYFLIGGGLIGAIRHKGFIPWDDDLDVGMLRADYDIFMKYGQELLPEKFFIQTRQTDPEYLNYFAKIRNSETTFLETKVKNHNINHGVFIDVFPFDYYPDDKSKAEKLDAFWENVKKRISIRYYNGNKLSIRYIKKLIELLPLIIKYPSIDKLLDERENIFSKIKKTSKIRNWGGAWGKKEIADISWVSDVVKMDFENSKVLVPIEWDRWLTHVYGDYMQIPPVSERKTYHYTDVIDTTKSYREYL